MLTTKSKSKSQVFDDRFYLQPFLNKKYAMAHCDGKIDDVLRAMGVGAARRAMFRSALQRMELTEQDGVYTLHVNYAFREMTIPFRIGVEFDDVTPTKQKVRSVFHQNKTTLTQVMRGDKTVVIVREFQLQPEQVVVTVQLEDIVAKRIYKPFTRHA